MKAVIPGGAGFIGCNLADALLEEGNEVVLFDNLSRRGSKENVEWLQSRHKNAQFVKGDIRTDQKEMEKLFADADAVYHVAAQVAVTTSVAKPREDFEINALGTFNVLETARNCGGNPTFIYASTNKVYGGMEDIKIGKKGQRYAYKDLPNGIPEDRFLDFHSPYGCSKGCGDQYTRDYARIYGMKTVVFRQSCIYGHRQFGIEDQGWVAWFTIASVLGKKITIYGDGMQVRDVLYIDDLVRAFKIATQKINSAKGKIYNIGGGPKNTMSLLELIGFLEKHLGRKINYAHSNWRPGDQPVYVSDIRKAKKELDWEPKVGAEQGVARLLEWAQENKHLFKGF